MNATPGAPGLWWALAQMTGQAPPVALAAPYRAAIAAFAGAVPAGKPARAQLLARLLADIAAPPIARYVAQLDPSWREHLGELIEPRVLALALGHEQATTPPEPLRAWAIRAAAVAFAPGAILDETAGWLARYTDGPWHEVQDALARDAARHLADAAAAHPGLLPAMADVMAEARDHQTLHHAGHRLGRGEPAAALPWPTTRRGALRAFHACASPKRLLEVAVRMLAPLPMLRAQRARLAHRLPRSMIPLLP
ncbi:MAG: hypothetical protein IPL79_06940 [Myxococcales bacterium]|nr:hypothetical protein [Myxococcales bacterium]